MIAKYILLADSAIRSVDGKLSIMGIFKNISAHKFPAKHSSMTLIVELEVGLEDVGNHQFRFEQRDYDGRVLSGLKIPNFNIPKPAKGSVSATLGFELPIHGMVFPKPGTYELVILCDDEYLTSVDISIIELKLKKQ